MELQFPICRRCCKNPVGFKAGKPMKTCSLCLKRLRKYQKENFKRRENETNSVICSTCNRKPAMIRGNKQYHTCKICSDRKKSAYHEDRARTRHAMNFYNFAMEHYDDLPQEIFSPVLTNNKLLKP